MRGAEAGGVRRWLGIPYARAARFEAPGPAEPWAGERDASRFGAQSPQQIGPKVRMGGIVGRGFDEDCHRINVWAPVREASRARPVFVWFHGGAFLVGGTNLYDGAELADEGDMVVVTANYRLGALGFTNFGEALGETDVPTNLGLRDMIAALEWVRDNIATFGGDPARVTVSGQSAGSISVAHLLQSERTKGLFRAALMQSGATNLSHELDFAVANGRDFAATLGLGKGDFCKLRAIPIETLLRGQAAYSRTLRNAIPAAPWFDGDLLAASLEEARRAPTHPVPLMAGTTTDEIRLFEFLLRNVLPTRREDYAAAMRFQLGEERTERILAPYPRFKRGARDLGSDLTFSMPTRHFAERHSARAPTWYYQFAHRHPLLGAAHGLDLLMFWPFPGKLMAVARGGTNAGPLGDLGRRMRADVAAFVRDLSPGESWPTYDAARQTVKLYGRQDRLTNAPDAARYEAWDGRDVIPGRTGPVDEHQSTSQPPR